MDGTINIKKNNNSNSSKYQNPYRASKNRQKERERYTAQAESRGSVVDNKPLSYEGVNNGNARYTYRETSEAYSVGENYIRSENRALNTNIDNTPDTTEESAQNNSSSLDQASNTDINANDERFRELGPYTDAYDETIESEDNVINETISPAVDKIDSKIPSQQVPEYIASEDSKKPDNMEPISSLQDSLTEKYYRLYIHWMLLVSFLWYWVGAFLLVFFIYQMSIIFVGKMSREPGPLIHLFDLLLFWMQIIIIISAIINLIQRYFKFTYFKYYLGDGKIIVKRYNRIQTINVKWGTYGEVVQRRFGLSKLLNYGTFRVYDPISKNNFELKYVKQPYKIAALINQDAQFIDKY